jgi:hypothetical protein
VANDERYTIYYEQRRVLWWRSLFSAKAIAIHFLIVIATDAAAATSVLRHNVHVLKFELLRSSDTTFKVVEEIVDVFLLIFQID